MSAKRAFVPFTSGQAHRPAYYRPTRRNPNVARSTDVWDVAHAFGIDEPQLAMALKYLLRAGKKPGELEAKDLTKALECIQRRLAFIDAAKPPRKPRKPTKRRRPHAPRGPRRRHPAHGR